MPHSKDKAEVVDVRSIVRDSRAVARCGQYGQDVAEAETYKIIAYSLCFSKHVYRINLDRWSHVVRLRYDQRRRSFDKFFRCTVELGTEI